MDGSSPIEFAISTPDADLQANINHALSLGLPEADCREKTLHLIANGPSAGEVNLGLLHGDTMALNGSIELFRREGGNPTYWIGCDPQEHLAHFLQDAPEKTVYLIASKCDRAVFDALHDRMVRLWHVNDVLIPDRRQVPCAVSVTLCAMMLAHRLGYRRIDVWGWDCSFTGEDHHAGPGTLSSTPTRVEIEVGEPPNSRFFTSTSTWAAEVKDASGILPVLRWCGTDVVIHGSGMMAAILEDYAA